MTASRAQLGVGRNLASRQQGRFPERPDAADQYAPTNEDRAQGAAPHRAAVDQQVLHPRSHAGEIPSSSGASIRPDRARRLLGQSRRALAGKASRNTCATACSRPSTSSRSNGREHRRTRSAYCVGGHAARRHAGAPGRQGRRAGDVATLFAAQSTSPMGDLKCSSTRALGGAGAPHDEQAISRAPRWQRLQHAALERADLALRVGNYLLGQPPFAFDLLYWKSDSTRMPAANHSFYLRNF